MNKQKNEKDRQILWQCLEKNNQVPLVQEYWKMVFFTVRKVLLNKRVPFCEQDLENLRNDVFVQLLDKNCKKLRQYKEERGQGLTAWIKLIVVHTTLNFIERKDPVGMGAQHSRVPLDYIQEKMGFNIEAQIDARISLSQVRENLKKLPPRYQLVLQLHYFDAVPIEKVAKAIQLPVNRAHTVLHRAREKLKKVMAEKKE
ncbi:RNA polymerase sigma-70 domain protein [Candidatus Magnetomorum sp. HK-1]|nr:RNA polymerase sigma-70 domain protein [Candidatus Magnetomorum sp. HK-1]